MTAAISKLYNITKPGGCVYVNGITPYVAKFAAFIPIYEQRLSNATIEWPGYVEDLQAYTNPQLATSKNFNDLKNKKLHFLNAELLQEKFEEYGFKVKTAKEFPLEYVSNIWQLDGRENVGVIACKLGVITEHNEL